MDHNFWQQRWQLNEIGFHNEYTNPYLEKHWPLLSETANEAVFVPLCGKSADLLWLKARGHRVIGVELSPIAVNAFIAENALEAAVSDRDGFEVNETADMQIWCGDYFALPSDNIGDVGLIYDRAALVALPPAMRKDYAAKLREFVKPGVQMLLIVFDYEQSEMAGPPFSVSQQEIESLYGDWCKIELLDSQNALDYETKFKERGVTVMDESVYKLTVI